MNVEDIEMKLLAGLPIQIENLGHYHSVKLHEIASMGESEYNNIVGYLLLDEESFDPEGTFKGKLGLLQMIASSSYYDPTLRSKIEQGLELFFREKANLYFSAEENEAFFYFGEFNEFRHLTEELWELFCIVLRLDNHSPKQKKFEEEYEFLTEEARLKYEEMQRKKANAFKPKSKINLQSIVSAMSNKSNSLNITNIWDLTLYQIYDSFKRLDHIGHYEDTILGIYTGNIEGKKIKLADIHWANIINNK
jgi:hypothetical protein